LASVSTITAQQASIDSANDAASSASPTTTTP